MINCKFYVIHNLDKQRYDNMINLFSKYGINISDVTFINHPNKDELTYKIKKNTVQKGSKIKDGWISCSYKHYLALEQIVKNKDELAVIMEDNIGDFYENVMDRLSKYLEELPNNWDVLYDSVWEEYSNMNEEEVSSNKLVYKKSNGITRNRDGKIISHGGTRAAQFYLVNKKSAKKMYDNFLPFNHSADMWMNEVLRKANLKSFWSEPSLVSKKFNTVTSTNLNLVSNFFYILKSKIINYRLGIKSPIWPRKGNTASYPLTTFKKDPSLEVFSKDEKKLTKTKSDEYLNFLFCFDDNYYFQSFTAIYSLLKNVSKKINILIIHNKPLSIEQLPLNISLHNNLASFQSYTFNDYDYNFPNLKNAHLSEATYYRLFIENYLDRNIDQLIYLDGDTVCISDPINSIESQLEDLKKSDNILAARTEYTIEEYPDSESFVRLNMDSSYFNAGVLLIDYKKWRANSFSKSLVEHMQKIEDNVVTWDQDVMNSLLNGNYLELNGSLNFNANSFNKITQSNESASILHYIGSKKPWLTSGALSYPISSNYYHRYYSEIAPNSYHITHKWRRASLFQYLGSIVNLKLFKIDNPLIFTKELLKSFFNYS